MSEKLKTLTELFTLPVTEDCDSTELGTFTFSHGSKGKPSDITDTVVYGIFTTYKTPGGYGDYYQHYIYVNSNMQIVHYMRAYRDKWVKI